MSLNKLDLNFTTYTQSDVDTINGNTYPGIRSRFEYIYAMVYYAPPTELEYVESLTSICTYLVGMSYSCHKHVSFQRL